jgi:superfamily II DNA or RNA helicase
MQRRLCRKTRCLLEEAWNQLPNSGAGYVLTSKALPVSDILCLNANIITITNDGSVGTDVWESLCDATSHALVGYGPSHLEVAVHTYQSWLWWFATPDNTVNWNWTTPAAEAVALHSSRVKETIDALEASPTEQVEQPISVDFANDLHLERVLTIQQTRDVTRMIALGGGANFSVPGAGKTTCAYATWAALRHQGRISRCVIVAPLSAHEAWKSEPPVIFDEEHQPIVRIRPRSLAGDVVVVNYERLEHPGHLEDLLQYVRGASTLVIFDEAHRAKAGPRGKRGLAARQLAAVATNRIVLTGTPQPNSPDDLTNVLDLAYPGRGAQLTSATSKNLRRSYVRTTKDELGLPPLQTRIERVPMSSAHDRVYEAMTGAAAQALIADPQLAHDVTRVGRIVMLLLQAATDPTAVLNPSSDLKVVTDDNATDLETLLKQLPQSFTPTKFVRLQQLVSRHAKQGTKVLVWSSFRHNINRMQRLLEPFEPATITGDVPVQNPSKPTDRIREIERFRTDPRCTVLIATPHTLSEGISLHKTTTHQIHVDRTFNAGMFLQALDRTHRLGLAPSADCTTTYLLAQREDGSATIDDLVTSRLEAKISAMSQVLNDPNLRRLALPETDLPLSADDVFLGPSWADDLAELFVHLSKGRRPKDGSPK